MPCSYFLRARDLDLQRLVINQGINGTSDNRQYPMSFRDRSRGESEIFEGKQERREIAKGPRLQKLSRYGGRRWSQQKASSHSQDSGEYKRKWIGGGKAETRDRSEDQSRMKKATRIVWDMVNRLLETARVPGYPDPQVLW